MNAGKVQGITMKFCRCGENCKPYIGKDGALRCKKCGEKIEKNNNIVIGIDPFEDGDPSTSYEEEHDF